MGATLYTDIVDAFLTCHPLSPHIRGVVGVWHGQLCDVRDGKAQSPSEQPLPEAGR